ncbi:hypothetical protein A3D05_04235 [Candidatus Gottesmanbacteria bacterium RIFCSPHIGHO2_02_FULL_40_24]|uniref:Pseudouridine synthase n=1 Tax=Candidatus Gottesmanbacteria bacterium RIFCSPHIGHO2_01_FULL_40_15 TaxID=1798376 RepID=A0A1F5Z0T8_9BACT|nr:MAG: hypothetical protein A2777_01025 [Candidatus Gottesmanbacteria bacterium RIFCSPHIGHO2_01_FULL_40_15]OGG17511.1 MAG: hypothetical protein A3D05_04235 [Candidatus Gottesmanbacteria bacterium RIFCSPHIGHO2_02_FULL_40_24]OGG25154.1 MAG: hypothetical protein A3E42_01150 [Candidatus Gottesmanbacteria bacterium RIFCSPHIGHO2_12_FULL_40_13]
MKISVIYEDDDLLVIDKPSGMIVNKAETVTEETVADWAGKKLNLPGKSGDKSDFTNRSGIVHRLDKDTSGLLLIAKNKKAFDKLQEQFLKRTVKKKYIALVHGRLPDSTNIIKAPVGRLPWNRRKFGVLAAGRDAETKIKVKSFFKKGPGNKYTLLEAEPVTGRTHQIRIHLKHIFHSIVSDRLYSGRKTLKQDEKIFPRLFLHACRLSFIHPVTTELITVTSPMPSDLEKALGNLEVEQTGLIR